MDFAGKILDIFMLVEYDIVDHLLIGLLTSLQNKLLEMKQEDDILVFFKEGLMNYCLKNDNIGSFMLLDSLEMFLN